MIAAIALPQHGVVSRRQLVEAGLTRHDIERRLRHGELIAVHRGVFAVGHLALAPHARERAGLLAVGEDRAFLTHHSAARRAGLSAIIPPPVHITLVGRRARPRAGIVLHTVGAIDPLDVTTLAGVPLTAVGRTLVDLAAILTADELARALNEARVLTRVTDAELAAALARNAGRPGAPALRALLEDAQGFTRSKAERLLLKLLREAGLPRPLTNVNLLGYEVDVLWPEQRLVVEFDGYAAHGHRAAFERDRRRDRALVAAGYRVIRVTWRALRDEPQQVADDLRRALRGEAVG